MPLQPAKSSAFVNTSLLIFISRFLPSVATFMVLIMYSRQLPLASYGVYQDFWVKLYIFSPFACAGLHLLFVTYSKEYLARLIRPLKATHFILFAIWVFAWALAPLILTTTGDGFYKFLVFSFFCFFVITTLLESALTVFRKLSGILILNIFYSSAFVWLHWHSLHIGFSMSFVVCGLGIMMLAKMVVVGTMLRREFKKMDASSVDASGPPIQQVRHLWGQLGIYDVSQMLFNYIDKFLVAMVLPMSVSAIYYNGSQNIPFLPILLSAAGSAILMQMGKQKDDEGHQALVGLMNSSGRWLSCLVFPLFFFLLFNSKELLLIFFGDKYEPAVPIFLMAILVIPLKAYSFTTVLQRLHKGYLINIGALIDLALACGLIYPFYKWLGLPGIALSFVVTSYLQAAFYLVYSARLLNTKVWVLLPLGNWVIKLIVFAALSISIHYIAHLYLSPLFALILAALTAALASGISLIIEYRKQKSNGFT